ncbi:MAG: heme exporter protein CcmB [Nitrospira sp.]|jgi:heme exporter protein B|nr:heme exporter protein CcmB [Nitrospira sp.]
MTSSGMMATVLSLMRRDLLLAWRRRADLATTLFFFVIVASLFPLGVGPEPAVLRTIAPGVLWIAALLSSLLSLGRLFSVDYQDGTLEQMMLVPQPLAALVFGKIAAHWLVAGLPVVVLSPLIGLQFGLSGEAIVILSLSLLLGTPTLSLVGAIGAALTLGVRGSHLLSALLVLPLFVPVLIFGAGAVASSEAGMGAEGHLSLLGACAVLAVPFAPWATAAALRIAVE